MNNKMIFISVLSGLAALFILQNISIVEIRFLFWSMQLPRSVFMFLLLAIGVVIGWVLHGNKNRRVKSTKE
jgi:uncharacterized integral membrane protein